VELLEIAPEIEERGAAHIRAEYELTFPHGSKALKVPLLRRSGEARGTEEGREDSDHPRRNHG